MPPIPPVGPLRVIGRDNPMYVLPFDKHGATTAPQTLEHARATLRSGGFTDVYLFSHGWNNDWATATGRYRRLRRRPRRAGRRTTRGAGRCCSASSGRARSSSRRGSAPPPWRARPPTPAGRARRRPRARRRGPPARAERERRARPTSEAAELAGLLSPVADPAALTAAARAIAEADAAPSGGDWGTVTGATAGPAAAGVLAKLDPRNLIRAASVWQMKDRAGLIGTTAVAPLLHDALAGTTRARPLRRPLVRRRR